ncbi:unnamed protein product [Schistosoma mattheei]|uniref:Uncharacterized protein n=1 Tax=Schistosoma mattheei TaxID=31246 RepID=A0A183PGJ1_9TREM|nr:unnamed protein product [Schistosoma mattheei]
MESNVVDLDGTNECNNISKRIKIILVGNSNVGKSSLLKSFTKGSDENEPVSTIGTDLKLYEMRLNGELIKLYIWVNTFFFCIQLNIIKDTAGTERFKNHMSPSYFRHAQVYDVGCQKSFEELNTWVKMIEQYSGSRLVKVIIGNKNDLPARAISIQKAEEYAKSINCVYLETSAKTGLHVRQAFVTLVHLTKTIASRAISD